MKKRITDNVYEGKRLLNLSEVSNYLGLGLNCSRKYMDEIKATRKYGKRVLFDKQVIDAELNKPNLVELV